jgi:hypothetical protein
MYSMSFTLWSSNLVLSIPSAKHNEVSWRNIFVWPFAHSIHNLQVKLKNFVAGSSRQQWEFTWVANFQSVV